MTVPSTGNTLKNGYQDTRAVVRKVVQGAAVTVEATEGFKKIFQIAKGVIELTGVFTNVGAFSPILHAAKIVNITISGFDIIGRIKEWVVPSNGQTLINKHWTKIISRIHLTFANFIDLLKMLEFFKIFKIVKLDLLAAQMGKIYFFRVLFNHFPGLDVIKHPFIAFSATWSIFDSSLSIHRKRSDLQHIKHKKRNWEVLGKRSYERKLIFFERKIEKYEISIADCENNLKTAKKNREKRRLNLELKALNTKLPKYEKLVNAISKDLEDENHVGLVTKFTADKAAKWKQKVKNIKLDFAKAAISITCEVAKTTVVTLAFGVSLLALAANPIIAPATISAILIILGLASNSMSLGKFILDKVFPSFKVPYVSLSKLVKQL